MSGFNMTMREAKQRAEFNGCYCIRNRDGTFSVGSWRWPLFLRRAKEFTTDCLETAVLKTRTMKDA